MRRVREGAGREEERRGDPCHVGDMHVIRSLPSFPKKFPKICKRREPLHDKPRRSHPHPRTIYEAKVRKLNHRLDHISKNPRNACKRTPGVFAVPRLSHKHT